MANSIKIKRSAVAAKVPLTTDLALGELAINTYDGKLYLKKDDGTEAIVTVNAGGAGSGDVVGPGSSTDNAITRFDGATGKLIQNSTATLDDSGVVSVSGANISGLTASYAVATDGSSNLVSVANTGTGDNVLATSPTLITPALGTPSALVGTNISGTATAFTASNVTTNANLTGPITSVGNATSIASQTGTGSTFVMNTSPVLVTPALGTPSALVGTNITGTATSFNINGTVGATTPAAGTFTSLTDSGNLTFTGTGNRITGDFSNATVANRVIFQTSTVNGNTLVRAIPNGTATQANIAVTNSSDPSNCSFMQIVAAGASAELTSGINGTGTYLPMTFNTGGSERARIDTSGNVGIGTSSPVVNLNVAKSSDGVAARFQRSSGGGIVDIETYNDIGGIGTSDNIPFRLNTNNTERMRIDSSGNVGIGTSNPAPYGKAVIVLGAAGGNALSLQKDSGAGISFYGTSFNNTGAIDSSNSTGAMSFYTGTSGIAAQAVITAAGLLQFNSGYGSIATAYGCRAWVNFNGTGTVAIRASGNVSSITDGGTGTYTVNFTTAMPDANYVVFGNTTRDPFVAGVSVRGCTPHTLATGSVSVPTFNLDAAAAVVLEDTQYISVSIFR